MKKSDVVRLAEMIQAKVEWETDHQSRGCMYYLKIKVKDRFFAHTAYNAREAYAFLSGISVGRDSIAPVLENEWAPNPTLQTTL